MIDTSNDFMLIEEYEIMLVINHINEKNRKMFFDNIVYVSFIDVILMFVTRFKKQDFVWNMYKKALMKKSIDIMICDFEKKHDLFFLKYRSIEKFVNAVQLRLGMIRFGLVFAILKPNRCRFDFLPNRFRFGSIWSGFLLVWNLQKEYIQRRWDA
jgi:hypothetical protein